MSRIEELAQSLLRQGQVTDEADARLAALHILLAAPPRDESASGHGVKSGKSVQSVDTRQLPTAP